MVMYMRGLGVLLCALGLIGTVLCWNGAVNDEVYFRALKGVERYPANVLYQTEFKMAQPRHMLLLAGASTSAPLGFVLGSLCLGMGSVLVSMRSGLAKA
jgi:hypothetical protein